MHAAWVHTTGCTKRNLVNSLVKEYARLLLCKIATFFDDAVHVAGLANCIDCGQTVGCSQSMAPLAATTVLVNSMYCM